MADPIAAADPSRFRRAYDATKAEADALPKDKIESVNVDIEAIAFPIEHRLPRLLPFREQIQRELPHVDIAHLDNLPRLTLALIAAQRAHDIAIAPGSITELGNQLTTDFGLMMLDAELLAKRNLIQPERIEKLRARSGYTNLIWNVLDLVAILREAWGDIQGKTALTLEVLDKAEADADRLASSWAATKDKSPSESVTYETRARFFTLFVRSHDEVRRWFTFLRWEEDDIDDIIPSLFAENQRGRSDRKSKRQKEKERQDKEKQDPQAQQPAPVAPPNASPAAPHPATEGTNGSARPVGPNADPFSP